MIVPPEYKSLGCLPPEQFIPQLMKHLSLEYYVGLLSAAEFHGAAHQRPQTFQVVVALNRPLLRCGEVRVQFIARRNVSKMPTVRRNTPRGFAETASSETTALDELLGTKLRALYQRKRGRDLFDLWYAGERANVNADRVVECLRCYLEHDGIRLSRACPGTRERALE